MISRNIIQKVILLIAVILLAGCRLGASPPQVGEIQVQPSTTITTNDTASLRIPASGRELEFEWSVIRGTLSDSTQPAVIYTAPGSPGPDTVTVKVTYSGGEFITSIKLDVVEPPPPLTPTAPETPLPPDTPTLTAVPDAISCDLPPITRNLFPELAEETGQFPIYGPVGDPNETNFLCEAVYDIIHNQSLAVHMKYENVESNFGWWGIATPNGYDASQHSQLCFWAYVQEPNQSFRLKMKDTTKIESGVVITIETPNQWTRICTDISKFAELGIQVDKMDNVNLGFEQSTGSAEIWIADFAFVSFIPNNTFTPEITGVSTSTIETEKSTQTITSTPTILAHTPNATQIFQAFFDIVDRQYQESIKANIVYPKPKSMKLDETVVIELLLNPSQTQGELATQMVESSDFVTSVAEPGQLITGQGGHVEVVTSEIQVTDRMKAVLISQEPDAFIIKELHDTAVQPISGLNTTKWRWSVTAKEKGTKSLIIVISRLIEKNDIEYWVEVESYRANIVIEVTVSQWFKELDWRWILGILITALFIPLFFRWYDSKNKKSAEEKNRKPPRKGYKS